MNTEQIRALGRWMDVVERACAEHGVSLRSGVLRAGISDGHGGEDVVVLTPDADDENGETLGVRVPE